MSSKKGSAIAMGRESILWPSYEEQEEQEVLFGLELGLGSTAIEGQLELDFEQ